MKICDFLSICSNIDGLTLVIRESDGGAYFEGTYDELDNDLLTAQADSWEISGESTLTIYLADE